MKERIIEGKWLYLVIICSNILFAFVLLSYLSKATYNFPLMDWWLGNSEWIEKIFENKLTFNDIFPIPHPLHVNPIGTILYIITIKYLNMNVQVLMYIGAMLLIVTNFFIGWEYYNYMGNCSNTRKCIFALAYFIVPFTMININQWEILTLYCSASFYLRIFLYILLFILISRYIISEKKMYFKAIIISLAIVLIILGVSQAYFPGFVVAICFALGFDIVVNKRNVEIIKKYSIIIGGCVLGCLIYLATYGFNGQDVNPQQTEINLIIEFVKGFVILLASPLFTQDFINTNEIIYGIVGTLMIICICFSIYYYIKNKKYEKSYLPGMCIAYGLVSNAIIIIGRMGRGVQSLVASRYICEEVILYLGVVLIIIDIIAESLCKKYILRGIITCGTIICYVVLLVNITKAEFVIGPYRADYRRGLEIMALDIDNYSNEELSQFQAPAEEVRKAVDAMKRYNLGIFRE